MTELMIDYSAGKLSSAAIKAARFNGQAITGAIRYIDSPVNLKTKHTSVAEYNDLVSHGIKVRLVFESGVNDSAGGRAAGVAFAQRALAGADSLGYTGVIYFCNDQTTLPSISNWQAYLDGAASVLGIRRVGAYGFRNAIDAAQGHASTFWQSGAQSALRPGINAWQWNNGNTTIAGIVCDVNYVYSDYSGTDQGAEDMTFTYNDPIAVPPFGPNDVRKIGDVVNDTHTWASQAVNQTADLDTKLAALDTKVTALASGGVDVNALAAQVAALVISKLEITVTSKP